MERDPRINPLAGDVLLGDYGAFIVGYVGKEEVQYGCGDHRYWYATFDKWKELCAEAIVLHTVESDQQIPCASSTVSAISPPE